MAYAEDWKTTHTILGCAECRFADAKSLNVGPCCQHVTMLDVGDDGVCKTRAEKKEPKSQIRRAEGCIR